MTAAILLAGGSGKRMGGVDKLLLPLGGVPLLARVLRTFQQSAALDEIILVARADRLDAYQRLAHDHGITRLKAVVEGGAERQDSVWNGLLAAGPTCELVFIHDAARALVTEDILLRCARAARAHGAAIPAARVKDTIKRVALPPSDAPPSALPHVEATLDRSTLWSAQTPQTFRMELIRRAYEPLIRQRIVVTDDAAAVERLGHPVVLVECDASNLKVTTPEDLPLAEALLARRESTT